MVELWEVIVVLSVVGSAATGLWFFKERAFDVLRRVRSASRSEIIEGIFGPESGVRAVTDAEFERLAKTKADAATERIDRISVHLYTVDKLENEQFRDEHVRHRILLLKPTRDGNAGRKTGYETMLSSPYDENDLVGEDAFEQPFGFIYKRLVGGEWRNVEVRLYETTPWLRGVLVDDRSAGVIVVPTIQGGREATKFWTEKPETVAIFTDVFEDIWYDERTTDFVEWYAERADP